MPPKPTKKLLKCFVPNCENVEGCGKIFLHTPRNPETFKGWCEAVGAFSGGKCCEDHFELSKDAENWQYFKLCGNGLRIRKGVVPHRYLDSKCPDTGSQFSDDDKKIKLEFLNSLVCKRKIVTRVNRIEDLKAAAGPSEAEKLEELAKNNARSKRNSPQLDFIETTESAPVLEVTPDIYLCTCLHDLPTKTYDPLLSHKFSCLYSSQAPKTEDQYYEYILGPTTETAELDDRPQIPIATSTSSGKTSSNSLTGKNVKKKPPKKKPKVESEEEYLSSSESDLSMFNGDYSEEDPDYDPDPDYDRGDEEDLNFEEPAMAELKEDDLIKTALKEKPDTRKRQTNKRKPVKSKAKSRGRTKKANNEKLENQEVKSRPKRGQK
uniref:THAP-type domain-containing protein n=2 Tax=Lygus hesperus TaxID=30085 RepID=A0A0A9XZB1_LYGHE